MKRNVFYIERESFLRSMLEIAFKHAKEEIYTIDTIVDNYYLLDDLNPALIFFDVKTVGDELENLLAYHQTNLKSAVLIATGTEEDKEKVSGRVKDFILKPIPATNLVKKILHYLSV